MVSIKEYYSIAGCVPFINVDVAADNRLCVDPRAVRLRKSPQPYGDQAVRCADTFLNTITDCIFDGSPAALRRGRSLLKRFVEPWESRLGMSEEGFRGHGGASVVGDWIWNAFVGDLEALVRLGILHQLEDLPLFVDGIDKDITSDVATRIFFEPLGRFTEQMITDYPEFSSGGHTVRKLTKQVWNPATCEWDEAEFMLPVVNDVPLLLVPIGWARPTLLMSARRYYDTAVLSYAQMERAVVMSDGKLRKTRKDELRKQHGLEPGRRTSLAVTLRAIRSEEDLLNVFKQFVDDRYDDGEAVDDVAA